MRTLNFLLFLPTHTPGTVGLENAESAFSQQRAPLHCSPYLFLLQVTQGWGVRGEGGLSSWEPLGVLSSSLASPVLYVILN